MYLTPEEAKAKQTLAIEQIEEKHKWEMSRWWSKPYQEPRNPRPYMRNAS